MIFFSLEDYFYNIAPVKRWGFLVFLILCGSFLQYTRFINSYNEQKILEYKYFAQQEIIIKLKNILSQKSVTKEYCDFYKLDYDELKLLLDDLSVSSNYIKNMFIEPNEKEKILVYLGLEN